MADRCTNTTPINRGSPLVNSYSENDTHFLGRWEYKRPQTTSQLSNAEKQGDVAGRRWQRLAAEVPISNCVEDKVEHASGLH